MINGKSVGIDFGSSKCCVAVWMKDKVEIVTDDLVRRTVPSFLAFTEQSRLVGEQAKYQAEKNSSNTLFGFKQFLGRSFSQLNTKSTPFQISEGPNDSINIEVNHKGEVKKLIPEEIAAILLNKLKQFGESYIGGPIACAVITVPSQFNTFQRQALKDAATIAGIRQVKLISQTSAAALAYGIDKKFSGEETILIFDMGAQYLEVSIIKIYDGIFNVQASGGLEIGGNDFDQKLIEYFSQDFYQKTGVDIKNNQKALIKLQLHTEKFKRIISSASSGTIDIDYLAESKDYTCTLSRNKFQEICQNLFKESIELVSRVLSNAGIPKSNIKQINQVVLAGGSTRIPQLQDLLRVFFQGKQLNKTINPDEAVAQGAGLLAHVLHQPNNNQYQIALFETTQFPIGIEVEDGLMAVITPQNSTIPEKKSLLFKSHINMPVLIKLYEGNSPLVNECIKLGEFEYKKLNNKSEYSPLRVVQSKKKLKKEIDFELKQDLKISIDIDQFGTITLEITDLITNSCEQFQLQKKLNHQQIQSIQNELYQFKIAEDLIVQLNNQKNNLEKTIYNIRNEVQQGKTTQEENNQVYKYLDDLQQWIENTPNAKMEDFTQKKIELEQFLNYSFKVEREKMNQLIEELINSRDIQNDILQQMKYIVGQAKKKDPQVKNLIAEIENNFNVNIKEIKSRYSE